MRNALLKAIAVVALVGSTVVSQATPIYGGIGFNATFFADNADILLVTAVNDSGTLTLGTGTSGPKYDYNTLVGGAFLTDIRFNNGNTLAFTAVSPTLGFNVYTFSYTIGGQLVNFSMVNTSFYYKYETLAGSKYLTLAGYGTAYIKYASSGVDMYDPTTGTWILQGIQAGNANPTWTFNTWVEATPDGGTTLMLLGLALSGLGLIRRKLS